MEPPLPSELLNLRPSNAAGFAAFGAAVATTTAGVWLAWRGGVASWTAGQIALTVAFLQWFALLHECGHGTLFRARRLNTLAGHVAAAFAMIPFASWTHVHRRHHRWTGWQDIDPTAVQLTPRPRGRVERAIVNACWKCWIPLFAIAYRVANYWALPRLWRMFPHRTDRTRIVRDATVLAACYAAAIVLIGPFALMRGTGAAIVLAFIAEDMLLLSQHAHIPQHLSHGAAVEPFAAREQDVFTRSLRLPAWLSALMVHFDAHELHHMYPFVPGYRLGRVPYEPAHEVDWWTWMRASRRVRGEVLLFQNRTQTGWEI